MYLYHGTTWAFIVVQNTKRFFAGDCTKHQMYLYHSSRTGACSVEQAHTHIACTAVTGKPNVSPTIIQSNATVFVPSIPK